MNLPLNHALHPAGAGHPSRSRSSLRDPDAVYRDCRAPEVLPSDCLAAGSGSAPGSKAGQEAMDSTRLNLIVSTPVIPKENILLIEGIHDLFGERQTMEDLWQKWEQPEIWRLPHGHISALFVPDLTGRVLRWLALRLDKPFSPDRRTPLPAVDQLGSVGRFLRESSKPQPPKPQK